MLESLRKMSPTAKKKFVAFCTSLITLIILGLWALHSFGIFGSAFESTGKQGVALFSFVEQNVQNAYDAFQANTPKFNATSTNEMDASSTEIIATTTTNN